MEPKYPGCNCEECPLKDEGFVPPSGPEDSDILFIGQAPAYYEVRSGKPFSGPSGSVLDGSLESVGLFRKDVRTDNSVLCFNAAGSGDPSLAAVRACNGHIKEALTKSKYVVPMGNSALTAIFDREVEGITQYANTLFRHKDNIILPLIHPAFYLRQSSPEMFRDFLEGMTLLKDQIDGGTLWNDLDFKFTVFKTVDEVIPFLEDLRDNPPESIAVDLETDFPDPVRGVITGVSICSRYDEAFIIPWDSNYLESHGSDIEPLLEYQNVFDLFKEALEAQDGVVMHNAPFDARLLRREGINVRVRDDSLLMHYALDERATSQGLKKVAKVMLGIEDWESDLKKYLPNKQAPYTLIPPEVLYPYAARDACYTLILRDLLRKRLDSKGNEGPASLYENILIPCNELLMALSLEGVSMDSQILVDAMVEMPAKLSQLEKELEELSEDRFFNPRSPKQISEIMFGKLGLRKINGTSTNKEVLEQLSGEHPFVDTLIEYRQYLKVSSTYMENFAKSYQNGKGYPDLRLFGTVTGRLSGSKLNPLTMPRESRGDLYRSIKNVFIADPECFLWASDYKSAELRVMAVLANDEWLIDQLSKPDIDFHSLMAEQIFGDEFLDADKSKQKELRVIAKMFVFGLNYGREAPSIAKQLGCGITEASDLIARYFKPMPDVLAWRKEMERMAVDDEYLENPFGRRRRFSLITKDNIHDIKKQAINSPVQSTANDLNLLTMERIRRELGPEVRTLWPVHDSILMNVKETTPNDTLYDLKDILFKYPSELLNTRLPFYIDIAVGYAWGTLKEVNEIEEIRGVLDQLTPSNSAS
jgi:DNA polymerase-1